MSNELPEQPSDAVILNKEDLRQEASVLEYVNAAASSSNRTRSVIIVLIVAAVLAAIEIRNTSYSWIDSRIEVREAALKFYYPEKRASIAINNPVLYNRAQLFLDKHDFDLKNDDDKKRLEKELDDYRKAAIENINFVHIPFFGAVFDHNDIGMFAGFTFAVLLLWLRYSLARELSNLNLLFNRSTPNPPISKENFKRRYELLAMQQVLTVPRMGEAKPQYRWLPRVLYFIPLPIYVAQIYFDFTTIFGVGRLLGMGKSWLLVITSILFLILILIFTIWCIKILKEIDRVWDEASIEAYPKI
jgi:hypothetical protein